MNPSPDPLQVNARPPLRPALRSLWLGFCQAVTVAAGIVFAVSLLRPDWSPSLWLGGAATPARQPRPEDASGGGNVVEPVWSRPPAMSPTARATVPTLPILRIPAIVPPRQRPVAQTPATSRPRPAGHRRGPSAGSVVRRRCKACHPSRGQHLYRRRIASARGPAAGRSATRAAAASTRASAPVSSSAPTATSSPTTTWSNRADEIEVLLADGRESAPRWSARDPETDLAVLKVEPDGIAGASSSAIRPVRGSATSCSRSAIRSASARR